VSNTPAHQTSLLGELVCTNSFKSVSGSNAHGQLKWEMATLGSVLLRAARSTQVPAGQALAVDRQLFAEAMTAQVESHPSISVTREEVTALPAGPVVVATGPLTSEGLATSIQAALGTDGLAFYDSIAPIVDGESVDRSIAFAQGRYSEESDYLNCPMSENEYRAFIEALTAADVYSGHDWDAVSYFEGCLPIEVMAQRGPETLRFGPMKPIGLEDPRTGLRPFAVVQLRREDRAGQMWNLVGFQTRLKIGEQAKVFRMIPGLEHCEFHRHGSIHRNTYLDFPGSLTPYGSLRDRPEVVFAGQLTGVEGYTESALSGIMAGINLDRVLRGADPTTPPPTTMTGALFRYLTEADPKNFQPMNSNWGLVDPLPKRIRDRAIKREKLSQRARIDFLAWMEASGLDPVEGEWVEDWAEASVSGVGGG
jgi:methylenetetrahydrofolate--tRNA-(uracil-5-)-methyltransferase